MSGFFFQVIWFISIILQLTQALALQNTNAMLVVFLRRCSCVGVRALCATVKIFFHTATKNINDKSYNAPKKLNPEVDCKIQRQFF